MKAMNATQQLKAAALFSLGLACAATLSVIAGKPAATTIALQPAATAPLAPLGIVTTVATEHIPTVTGIAILLLALVVTRYNSDRSQARCGDELMLKNA